MLSCRGRWISFIYAVDEGYGGSREPDELGPRIVIILLLVADA